MKEVLGEFSPAEWKLENDLWTLELCCCDSTVTQAT
jgi:hypothetical protein